MEAITIKHGNANYILNVPKNQLTFLDSRFYQTEEGEFVPSVTTYLEAYPKSSQFYEWLKTVGKDADEIRDEAGRKGSNVHLLTEKYDKCEVVNLIDEHGFIAYRLSEWSMFERYVEFRKAYQFEIDFNELNLVSASLKIGGTIDRVIRVDNKQLLIDIKTSNSIHPHYWLQLAAYKKLYEVKMDKKIDGVGILWLNSKTRTSGRNGQIQGRGWQLCVEEDEYMIENYWRRFQACQQLWLAKNESHKPKNLVYSLSHQQSLN